MFLVQATLPIKDGWEELTAELYHRAGRRWDSQMCGDGICECHWYCETLGIAREMCLALKKVGGVSVVAREP